MAACADPRDPQVWLERLRDSRKRDEAVSFFQRLREHARTDKDKAEVNAIIVPALCQLYREHHELSTLKHIISFKDRSAIPTLLSALEVTGQPRGVALAAAALAELRAVEASEPLGRLLQREAGSALWREARVAAVKALGRLSNSASSVPHLMRLVAAPTARQQLRLTKAAVEALGAMGDRRAVPALMGALLMTSARGGDCFAEARVALCRMGPAATPALIAALQGKDPVLQGQARRLGLDRAEVTTRIAAVLGDIRAPDAVPALLELLRANARPTTGSQLAMAEAAAGALGRVADPRAEQPLLTLLANSQAPERLRIQTITALTDMGSRHSLPQLLRLASPGDDGSSANLREAAARAYGLQAGAAVSRGYPRLKEAWAAQRRSDRRAVYRQVLGQLKLATRCMGRVACYGKLLANPNAEPPHRLKAAVMLRVLPDGREALPQLARALGAHEVKLRRTFLRTAVLIGNKKDSRLLRALETALQRDARRGTRYVGGDLVSEDRVALVALRRRAPAPQPAQR